MTLTLTTDAQGITTFDPASFGTLTGNETWGLICSENARILSGLVSALGGGPITLSLDSLNDVVATSPSTGDKLRFDGTNWVSWTQARIEASTSDSTNLALATTHLVSWDAPTILAGSGFLHNGTTGFSAQEDGEVELAGTLALVTSDVPEASLKASICVNGLLVSPSYFGPAILTTSSDTQASCPLGPRYLQVSSGDLIEVQVSLESPSVPTTGTATLLASGTYLSLRYTN